MKNNWLSRENFEQIERQILAPYAVASQGSIGRMYAEEEHPFRSRFQRDRDRVIHSRAFRRLEYKTQVFVNHEGDYYRTRLTHSLEVAQIARTIARALRLNEDLAETISLTHDLGHTPFGHSGQQVMNRLMKDFGGFEHNRQSFRVVTLLEDRYPDFPGLNLTYEVLEGIVKHETEYDLPQGGIFERKGYPSLEAQICNFADEIAYNNHDIDDGIKSGMLDVENLNKVEIWSSHFTSVRKKYPASPFRVQVSLAVKSIINHLVTDLIEQTTTNIEKMGIENLEDVHKKGKGCVDFSPEAKDLSRELKRFLMENLYRHYRVVRMADKAERIMTELFKAYIRNPKIIPPTFLRRYEKKTGVINPIFEKILNKGQRPVEGEAPIRLSRLEGATRAPLIEPIERVVCDYIAGMTDRFALDEYKKLFDPHEKV